MLRGAELIGATRDASFPMPDGPWPGTGAVLAAIETAAGRTADRIVGKPEPRDVRGGAATGSARAACSAVGDRLEIDVAGARARRAGLRARAHRRRRRAPEADAADPRPTPRRATRSRTLVLR